MQVTSTCLVRFFPPKLARRAHLNIRTPHSSLAPARAHPPAPASSPQPPHDDEDPDAEQEEAHEPAPIASLSLGHVVHPPERATQEVRRGCKGVILHVFQREA